MWTEMQLQRSGSLADAAKAADAAGAEAILSGILADKAKVIAESRFDTNLLWALFKLGINVGGQIAVEYLRDPPRREALILWAVEAGAKAFGATQEEHAP